MAIPITGLTTRRDITTRITAAIFTAIRGITKAPMRDFDGERLLAIHQEPFFCAPSKRGPIAAACLGTSAQFQAAAR
jgi:hypothetical protein